MNLRVRVDVHRSCTVVSLLLIVLVIQGVSNKLSTKPVVGRFVTYIAYLCIFEEH